MQPDQVLTEVNNFAQKRTIPSLSRAASAWAAKDVTALSQPPLTREFDTKPVQLNHLWIDLQHCTFEKPLPKPAKSAAAKAKPKKVKKKPARKTKDTKKK